MKTIKERAWEKYPEVIKHHNLAQIDINEEKRKMYIEIATEQKVIDIDKACEWLKNNWREYVNQDRDGMILFGNWESDFRKAMEE